MSTTSQPSLDLRRLRLELAGEVIGPCDASYDAARSVFFPTVDKRPAAIVRPVDDAAVASVLALARETGVELAVRGGGHSLAGHGVSDGGLVLDLAWLDELEIDPHRRVATAAAGLTAGKVTKEAGAHGLGIGFGDTASVGIGGLTLGGGVGYLVRKHGLTVDSLLSARVVTADGRVLDVDAYNYPDLFWAIRGGGGNFGVVTSFGYRLHPDDGGAGGMLVLPATPETLVRFVEAADEASDELSTIANVMPAPPMPFLSEEHHGRLVLLAMLYQAGPREDAQRALAPFRSVAEPLADLLRPLSYDEMYPPENGAGPRASGRTLFLDGLDHGVAAEILGRLAASTAQMSVGQLRVLGGAMARVPADATAFAHRARRIMVNLGAVHASPDEARADEAWLDAFAESLRGGDDDAYVNFLGDEGRERARAAYPGETWSRLREVKRRYDPDNVFRVNHNVPPADVRR
ncbi:MAG: FAD-binding oxidoreductase [Gaiellaceae bacterium]